MSHHSSSDNESGTSLPSRSSPLAFLLISSDNSSESSDTSSSCDIPVPTPRASLLQPPWPSIGPRFPSSRASAPALSPTPRPLSPLPPPYSGPTSFPTPTRRTTPPRSPPPTYQDLVNTTSHFDRNLHLRRSGRPRGRIFHNTFPRSNWPRPRPLGRALSASAIPLGRQPPTATTAWRHFRPIPQRPPATPALLSGLSASQPHRRPPVSVADFTSELRWACQSPNFFLTSSRPQVFLEWLTTFKLVCSGRLWPHPLIAICVCAAIRRNNPDFHLGRLNLRTPRFPPPLELFRALEDYYLNTNPVHSWPPPGKTRYSPRFTGPLPLHLSQAQLDERPRPPPITSFDLSSAEISFIFHRRGLPVSSQHNIFPASEVELTEIAALRTVSQAERDIWDAVQAFPFTISLRNNRPVLADRHQTHPDVPNQYIDQSLSTSAESSFTPNSSSSSSPDPEARAPRPPALHQVVLQLLADDPALARHCLVFALLVSHVAVSTSPRHHPETTPLEPPFSLCFSRYAVVLTAALAALVSWIILFSVFGWPGYL